MLSVDFSGLEESQGGLRSQSRRLKGGLTVSEWSSELRLDPGQALEWPFLLRLTEEGQISLYCVWKYEASPLQPAMPSRLLSWSHSIQVCASPSFQAHTVPCCSRLFGIVNAICGLALAHK